MPKGLTYSPKSAYTPALSILFQNFRTNLMANHKSAKKRIIRNANRALINGARMSRIRTFVKRVEVAIASGDAVAAREALRAAQPELQRGISRGVLHKNTVSRKISRLAARVKALAA
jgi:small subunit ribosomal protein S20